MDKKIGEDCLGIYRRVCKKEKKGGNDGNKMQFQK